LLFIIAQAFAIRLLDDDFASLAALMGGDEDQLSDASVEQIA
jgi:hypothetical protein